MHYSHIGLLLLSLLIVSCKRQEPTFATPRKAERVTEPPLELFITRNIENIDDRNAVTEVSPIHTHRVVMMMSGLVPGKKYRATFRLIDPNGKNTITNADATINFSGDQTPGAHLYNDFPVS